jgi:hypothetical protein
LLPPQAEPVTVKFDLTNTDERLAALIRRVVRVDSGTVGDSSDAAKVDGGTVTGPVVITQDDPAEVYATGGVLTHTYIVGEQGPEPIGAADLERLDQWLTGPDEPMGGVEAPADSTMHEPATEVEGGEQPSPGTSSSTSSAKRKTTTAPKKAPRQSRVRTTANPSKPDLEVVSTADSADAPPTTSVIDPTDA